MFHSLLNRPPLSLSFSRSHSHSLSLSLSHTHTHTHQPHTPPHTHTHSHTTPHTTTHNQTPTHPETVHLPLLKLRREGAAGTVHQHVNRSQFLLSLHATTH